MRYVILARGTLTEQHLIGPGQCASEEVTPGSAFVEPPGLVSLILGGFNGGRLLALRVLQYEVCSAVLALIHRVVQLQTMHFLASFRIFRSRGTQ